MLWRALNFHGTPNGAGLYLSYTWGSMFLCAPRKGDARGSGDSLARAIWGFSRESERVIYKEMTLQLRCHCKTRATWGHGTVFKHSLHHLRIWWIWKMIWFWYVLAEAARWKKMRVTLLILLNPNSTALWPAMHPPDPDYQQHSAHVIKELPSKWYFWILLAFADWYQAGQAFFPPSWLTLSHEGPGETEGSWRSAKQNSLHLTAAELKRGPIRPKTPSGEQDVDVASFKWSCVVVRI